MFFEIFGRNMRLILIIVIIITIKIIIIVVVVITSLLSPFTFILIEPLFKDKDKKNSQGKAGRQSNFGVQCQRISSEGGMEIKE